MALFHSFLWLSNIPLYICTIALSVHQLGVKHYPGGGEMDKELPFLK